MTLGRWARYPWRMYQLVAISWVSFWQIIDGKQPADLAVSVAMFVGATSCIAAMHIECPDKSRRYERWTLLILMWALTCYLGLAFESAGVMGLLHPTSLGVGLTEAAILACLHRHFLILVRPWLKARAAKKEAGSLYRQLRQVEAENDRIRRKVMAEEWLRLNPSGDAT